MLDTSSPDKLWIEIQAAERFRKRHLDNVDELIRHYHGAYYDTSNADWENWSENHMFEFIRLTAGKIPFDNPRVRAQSNLVSMKPISIGLQYALNRWTRDTRLRALLKRVYVNMCFSYSVIQTTFEPSPWKRPSDRYGSRWARAYLVENDRFFFDPLCSYYPQARFAGHRLIRDKDDIVAEAEENPDSGWDADAVRGLPEGSSEYTASYLGDHDTIHSDRKESSEARKQVILYEVWIPEIETGDPELGYHGTIYTLSAGNAGSIESDPEQARWVRQPRPYWGPPTGPYTLFGVYPVPYNPWPLSPFLATYTQQQELNRIVAAINKNISEYRRGVFVNADNPDFARKIASGQDNYVIPIKGLKDANAEEFEVGGIADNQVRQLAQALERLDRNTGISNVQRGNVDDEATATAVATADDANEASLAYIKQEFTDAVTQVLQSIGWYLFHSDRVEIPIGEEAAAMLGMGEPYFVGGMDNLTGMDYQDIEMVIEPYSMERMSQALARAQYREMMQIALEAANVIPTSPYYDWTKLFEKGGEVLNDPQFADFYLPEIAKQTMMQQQMQQQQEMQQSAAESQAKVQSASKNGQATGGGTSGLAGQTTGAQMSSLARSVQSTQR